MTTLSNDTLDRIDALLIQNEWKGKTRGLYSLEQLQMIRSCLKGLAAWLGKKQTNLP